MDGSLAATASQWTADTNAAVYIRLISADTADAVLKTLDTDPSAEPESGSESEPDSESEDAGADVIQFHPAFTYAIYGEHERVFGYKDLRINLCYASGSLATFLWADHGKCITDMDTSMAVSLKADDVITPLRAVLSENALCGSKEEFAAQVARDTAGFRPFGRKVHG
ncbi:histone acetyltransferase 1, partial [Kickxella alabastrina]